MDFLAVEGISDLCERDPPHATTNAKGTRLLIFERRVAFASRHKNSG